MILSRFGAILLPVALMAAPAMATSFITDSIDDPSSRWAGIDYWGVQVSQFSTVDQTLSFDIPTDSAISVFVQGSPKLQFSDLLLNGQSIASDFTLGGSATLIGSGYASAGSVSLRFVGDYQCGDCWGDWFGGYVQVTQATIPTTPALDPVPEPAGWLMMLAGMGVVGVLMRRPVKRVSFS